MNIAIIFIILFGIIFILYPILLILLIDDIVLQVTDGNSKLFKGIWNLFKDLLFKLSTLKSIWTKSGQRMLIDCIVKRVRKEIPIVKFYGSIEMVSFTLENLKQNDSVLIVSNTHKIGKTCTHRLQVLGKRKDIKLVYTNFEGCDRSVQGIDYDYVLWIDVIKQEYVLYKKNENGRNVIREVVQWM